MNKKQLIDAIANDTGFTKANSKIALYSVLSNIEEALCNKEDGNVTLIGFGTFKTVGRKARTGRNPKTGETIKIKAKNTVTFKAGKQLKDNVN